MSLALSSITLDGVSVPFAGVLADLTIRHGRIDVFDDPQPSSAQLVLIDRTRAFVQNFAVGAALVINARDGAGPEAPRFTGRVTDAALDVDELTAVAVGRLATLNQYAIGAADWPAESWTARVTRAFTEAGLAAYLELAVPPVDPALAARAAATGPLQLGDYLQALAQMIGAAVVDRPNGNVYVQPLSARVLGVPPVLDPAEVEYSPAWTQVLPRENIVDVKWTGGTETATDTGSVALYGPRKGTIDTAYTDQAQARDRAAERVARGAYPHWQMPAAPVLAGRVYALGSPVKVTNVPPASPYLTWTPVVEGWTDTIQSDGVELTWRMELALSDPLASGLALPWNTVPTGDKWNTIDQAVAWKDALTLDALEV